MGTMLHHATTCRRCGAPILWAKMIHDLKCHPEPFQAIIDGVKLWEFRKDDRDPRYAVGDVLLLREWEPATKAYTARCTMARVVYLLRGPEYGIPEGYCVMSMRFKADP